VDCFRPFLSPEALPAGVRTTELDILCGQAAGHEEMFATIVRAAGMLTYVFDTADGKREVAASDL
jgi:hypothetical protein